MDRGVWLLPLALSCGASLGPEPSSPSRNARPSAAAASPVQHLPTFAAWDGLYARSGGDGSEPYALVRTLDGGVQVVLGRLQTASRDRLPDGGWRFFVHEGDETGTLSLHAPEPPRASWRLVIDPTGTIYEQHVPPLEARVRDRLVEGARFVRLDQSKIGSALTPDDAATRDTITVLPRGLVRIELPDGRGASCGIDALAPTVDDRGVPLPSPLPPEGALGVVAYTLFKIDEGCAGAAADEVHGVDGGVRIFADRDGRVSGMLVVAYMYAELFASPRVSRADLERMRAAAQAEAERQAE